MPTASTHLSDEELARQSRAGSLSGFEELVTRYESRVFRFLARCCQNEEDARELTQTAFVTAYRSVSRYDPRRPFATWLFTIARRKFIDHCRARRPTLPLESALEASDAADPAALLGEREQREVLWSNARRLVSPDQFAALWLRYQEDMSIEEVARSLQRTCASVKVLLFRARRTLIRSAPWLANDEEAGGCSLAGGPARTSNKSTVAAFCEGRPAGSLPLK